MEKIFVGSEIAKNYKTYSTRKEANAEVRKIKDSGYYVARLHNNYNREKFYGYIVIR